MVAGSGLRTADGERPHGKRPERFYLYRHGKESEIVPRRGGKVGHVLHDEDVVFQKDAMDRPPQILYVIDVVGIDAD